MSNLHYTTVYQRDYYPKTCKRVQRIEDQQQFKDPIGESFKNYLKIGVANLKAPRENVIDYFEKFKEKYPRLAEVHFQEPLDRDLIQNSFIKLGRSRYEVDYCDLVKDKELNESLREKMKITLPDDWEIPLTTQRALFKNPQLFKLDAVKMRTPFKPVVNLGNKEHLFKILKVKTGRSEYEDTIGDLGDIIVKEQLHGKIESTCLDHNL